LKAGSSDLGKRQHVTRLPAHGQALELRASTRHASAAVDLLMVLPVPAPPVH